MDTKTVEPTEAASKSTSHIFKTALYKHGKEEIGQKVRLSVYFGILLFTIINRPNHGKQQDSKVDIVHRYLTDGGVSILSAFFCGSLQMKLQDEPG